MLKKMIWWTLIFFSVSSPFYTTLILKNCISNRKLLLVKENKKVTGKIIYLNIAMIDMYWTMVPCRLLLILWCFLLIYKWSRMSLVFCSDSSELKHQMDNTFYFLHHFKYLKQFRPFFNVVFEWLWIEICVNVGILRSKEQNMTRVNTGIIIL